MPEPNSTPQEPNPFESLIHYTNQEGFLGILDSGEIWASKYSYLNDASELQYGVDLAINILRTRAHAGYFGIGDRAHDFVAVAEDTIRRALGKNFCVCSWSEFPTRLSMWRGYSAGSQGFGISFSRQALEKVSKLNQFNLASCEYDGTKQKARLSSIMQRWADQLPVLPSKLRDDWGKHATSLAFMLVAEAPFLKHHSFSEEREWRMVSGPLNRTHEAFRVRAGKSAPIPYFAFPLWKISGGLTVHIGPGPRADQASEAVGILRHKREFKFKWEKTIMNQTPFKDS